MTDRERIEGILHYLHKQAVSDVFMAAWILIFVATFGFFILSNLGKLDKKLDIIQAQMTAAQTK